LQILQEGETIAYLDEKWFYTALYRIKRKYLPHRPDEAHATDTLRSRKVMSRRHSLKAMFFEYRVRTK
jgi:hypothetical protein